jgi:hypothetical protein
MQEGKEHQCDKMPKDWVVEWSKWRDGWHCYSDDCPQETGMSDFFYCPWCGAKL